MHGELMMADGEYGGSKGHFFGVDFRVGFGFGFGVSVGFGVGVGVLELNAPIEQLQ